MTIGERLGSILKKKNMNQKGLSDKTGMSEDKYNKWRSETCSMLHSKYDK